MWIEWPWWLVAVVNCLGIPAVHFGMSWWFTRMPLRRFDPDAFPFRHGGWETADFYDHGLRVKQWKESLPDAGPWFGGFSKKRLRARDLGFLREFHRETCRSEAAHWAQVVGILVFMLWTPSPWAWVLPVYALASNLPCIVLQRRNRLKLAALLRRGVASGHDDHADRAGEDLLR
jgi:glycosyl-4,4'-diaponeurosporenoate acyltransferase